MSSRPDLPVQGVEVAEHPCRDEVVIRALKERGAGVLDRLASPQLTEQHTVVVTAAHQASRDSTGRSDQVDDPA